MVQVAAERDYAVVSFQVGIGPAAIAVNLSLVAETNVDTGLKEDVIIRLTPEAAKVLTEHLSQALKVVSMGEAPTASRQ